MSKTTPTKVIHAALDTRPAIGCTGARQTGQEMRASAVAGCAMDPHNVPGRSGRRNRRFGTAATSPMAGNGGRAATLAHLCRSARACRCWFVTRWRSPASIRAMMA